MKIAILGTGYVGLVAAVCFADAGFEVIGVDSNAEKIATLQGGFVPFFEPGLEELFLLNQKRMRFTTDLEMAAKEAKVIFVAVGTPEQPDGSADMAPTWGALRGICKAADGPKTIVLKSTVPVGTAAQARSLCADLSAHPMDIVSNPEFLRQGAALEDFLDPDRIVIGCQTQTAKEVMGQIYAPFISKNNKPILFMDNTSAEMTKYAANAFLALKISYINELALLCDRLGADVDQVRAGFTSDSRINPAFFNPGIGYGGSCFPKDVRALIHLSQQHDLDLKLLRAADDVNERQKTILTERLIQRLGSLKGKTIGVWGLAFKPRTDDVRRAPSLKIIEELFLNGAKVLAYDPVASDNAKAACRVPFELCDSALKAVQGVDALLVLTEWQEFKAVDWTLIKSAMNSPIVLDGRNIFDPKKLKSLGIDYSSIGRDSAS